MTDSLLLDHVSTAPNESPQSSSSPELSVHLSTRPEVSIRPSIQPPSNLID